MRWIRRIAAAPLLLLTFICMIGTVRIFARNLPDSTIGEGFTTAFFAAVTATGAYFLLRPDVRALEGLSFPQVRKWFFTNPLGQAGRLWAAAAVIMAAAPRSSLLPGFVARCVSSIASAGSAVAARRWWAAALLAVLGFILLMGALAATAEGLAPRGVRGGRHDLPPPDGGLTDPPRGLRHRSQAQGHEARGLEGEHPRHGQRDLSLPRVTPLSSLPAPRPPSPWTARRRS